jgi:MtrB/PioB family decaheme-associated outer membrane protein
MNRTYLSILVASLFSAPVALAQDADPFRFSGSIGVGGMAVDDDVPDAAKLREYRDLSDGLLTIFDIKGRNSRWWLDLFGENLGRDDQYVNLRGGMYDTFKYRLYSDALKHNFMLFGITPYNGAGTATQRTTFPRLDPSTWNPLELGYKRRDDGVMFEYQRASPWYARVEANQVTWSGTKAGSSSQGTSPGNGFVQLAFPVDYTTRNAIVEGGYNSRTMRFDLSWTASKFENDNQALTWTNGYFGNGIDTTYLAADNRYQRLMGNAVFRQLPWNTTLAARFTMDELKSAVTVGQSVLNGTTGAISPTNPNMSVFDGKVSNNTFTVSASSMPTRGLDTKVYYNYRKRDDESSAITFASPVAEAREGMSYEKNNWGFDAYYRFNRSNRFGLGFDWLETDREGRHDYDNTKDQRFFAEWKNTSLDNLSARLKYTYLDRDSNFLNANSGTSVTDPAYLERFVTAFDLANVEQDQWKLTLDWTVAERLDIGFEGIIKTNKYKDNTLGRLKEDRREIYMSASYAFPNGARFTLFGDAEEIKYDSLHRVIGDSALSGANDPSSAPTASNYNWAGNIKDRNWATGLAFDWPFSDRFSVKASAIYYKTDGFVDLSLEQGVPSSVTSPVPIANWDDTKRKSFTLKGVYDLTKTMRITGGYAFEKYEYSDSQTDGYRYIVAGSSNQNSYLNGFNARPQYRTNILYAVFHYRF